MNSTLSNADARFLDLYEIYILSPCSESVEGGVIIVIIVVIEIKKSTRLVLSHRPSLPFQPLYLSIYPAMRTRGILRDSRSSSSFSLLHHPARRPRIIAKDTSLIDLTRVHTLGTHVSSPRTTRLSGEVESHLEPRGFACDCRYRYCTKVAVPNRAIRATSDESLCTSSTYT